MTEARSFSPETWVPQREAFIFRFRDRGSGAVATFCVLEATLKELKPWMGGPFRRVAAFNDLRPLIYRAATESMRTGGSMIQHVVTTQELKTLRDGFYIPPQGRESPARRGA